MLEDYYPHNKNITLFLLITFSFSWLFWLPSLLSTFGLIKRCLAFNGLVLIGSFGPSFAAIVLTSFCEGFESIKNLWYRCWHWNKWYYFLVAAFLIPFLFGVSFILVSSITGKPQQLDPSTDLIYIFYLYLLVFFLGGPLQEEIGWRGYLLEHLQSIYDALNSSIIVGGIWGLWHFPLFYITGSEYMNQTFFFFLSSTILLSILFTWLYNNTNGSVFVVMVFHSSINVTNFLFQQYTPVGYLVFSILLDLVVVIVLLVFGSKTLTYKKRNKKLDRV